MAKGIYQRLFTTYHDPDRRRGTAALTAIIDALTQACRRRWSSCTASDEPCARARSGGRRRGIVSAAAPLVLLVWVVGRAAHDMPSCWATRPCPIHRGQTLGEGAGFVHYPGAAIPRIDDRNMSIHSR